MIPTNVQRMLFFYDLCGFNSGLTIISKNSRASYFVYFVHFCIASSLTYFKFSLIFSYYPLHAYYPLGTAMSESLQYFSALYTYWLIIFDSFYHRKTNQNFWALFQLLYTHLKPRAKLNLRAYLLKLIELFAATFSINIALFIMNDFNLKIASVYLFLIKICQFRVFYYILCLEVIQSQLQVIEFEMKTIQNRSIGKYEKESDFIESLSSFISL